MVEEKETKLSGIASAAAVIERQRDEVFGHGLRLPLFLKEKESKLSGIASAGAVVERERGEVVGHSPVSYTHLDVYKRQETKCSGIASGCRSG